MIRRTIARATDLNERAAGPVSGGVAGWHGTRMGVGSSTTLAMRSSSEQILHRVERYIGAAEIRWTAYSSAVPVVIPATESPAISVLMVVYGGGALAIDAVASLVEHTSQPFEVIVVDNASRDDSVSTIRRGIVGAEVDRRGPQPRFRRRQQPSGAARRAHRSSACSTPMHASRRLARSAARRAR